MIHIKEKLAFKHGDIIAVKFLFQTLKLFKITKAHLPRTTIYSFLEHQGHVKRLPPFDRSE